jgi:hypothetical protein
VSLPGIVSALATGVSNPLSWETWTPIGFLMVCLFGWGLSKKAIQLFSGNENAISAQEFSLLLSILLLVLLATGIAYRGHNLFDSFRTPARALAFIALATVLFVFINAKAHIDVGTLKPSTFRLFLFISAVQIAASAWVIRPEGSIHSPYEKSVQQLANILKADQAQSVWFSTQNLADMYIHVGLTRNNLALPVVYYGDMGQTIEIKGNHCGYSFDHLLTLTPVTGPVLALNADIEWSNAQGEILVSKLFLIDQVKLDKNIINVYRVVCD